MHLLVALLFAVQLGNFTDDIPLPDPEATAPIRFALDELDRLALTHNKNFRGKYMECLDLLHNYADHIILGSFTVGDEGVKALEQSQIGGRLKVCTKQLLEEWESLKDQVEDLKDAVNKLE